jgi:hypothetical protein
MPGTPGARKIITQKKRVIFVKVIVIRVNREVATIFDSLPHALLNGILGG